MGGFASQVYKFFLGAKISEYLHTELILDVSDYYDGYFRTYNLHMLKIPVFQTICTREIEKKYPHLIMVRNSDDMEKMIAGRRKGDYYIFREETDYAEFFWRHPEFEVDITTPYIKTLELKSPSEFIENFVKEIAQYTSVAVHIRRGDFVTLGQESKSTYFCAAIAWFYERNPKTQFYFFSNDLEWVKEQFGDNRQFHYVHAQEEKTGDIEELFCMSFCNFRILSNYSSYGLLANTFAAVRNAEGFALLEEKKSGEYEYKGIEGSIRYLSKEQICEYDVKYGGISWEKQERELNIRENPAKSLRKKMKRNGEEFFVITCERYSKWFRRGMFEISVRLPEKGYKVNYINLWNCLRGKKIEIEAACNMDGEEYGFDIVMGRFEEIELLMKKTKSITVLCDCKLPFSSEGKTTLIKLQSHKADLCQKRWGRTLWRKNIITGMRYMLRKESGKHRVMTQLNKYWEDVLKQTGKSDDDVAEVFNQVYKSIVEEIIGNKERVRYE